MMHIASILKGLLMRGIQSESEVSVFIMKTIELYGKYSFEITKIEADSQLNSAYKTIWGCYHRHIIFTKLKTRV